MQENLQQAEKIYFKSGKLSPKVREIILHITGGDNYTKIIADMYFAELEQSKQTDNWALSVIGGTDTDEKEQESSNDILHIDTLRELKSLYIQMKEYNKNVFPIKNLFNYSTTKDILFIKSALKQRKTIIELIKKLPSIAVRNLKNDIRQERDYPELQNYRSDLEYFVAHMELLNNRSDRMKNVVLNKMFKSNTTLEDLMSFIEEKENLLGGYKYSKNAIKKIISENNYDLKLIYESGDIVVVDVTGPDGIKKIGCNSVWCFTYGNGFDNAYRNWNNYSTNDHVYVIINFAYPSDSTEFMHVLVKPLDYDSDTKDDNNNGDTNNHDKLYNMANEMIDAPLYTIENIFGLENAKKLFHFDIEPPVRQIQSKPKKQYVNPNQLSLDFPEPELRQVAELRKHIRLALRENVRTGKNPFTKYQLSSAEYEDAVKHINNVLKYGRTNFTFSEFDTHKYHKHKPTLNAIFDYLALNYHTQKKIVKNNIYTFLFANLVPTNKSGELNAIGKTLYTILRNHIPTGQEQETGEEQLKEDYPGEDLDSLRSIYYNPESGFNKALNNYHYQNSSFLSFLLTVLSQNMIDNYKRKSFQSDGVRRAFKTYSLDEPIDFNQYTGNRTTGEKRAKPDYDSFGGSSQIKFLDALASQPNEEDDDDIFKDVDITKLRRAVIDFILTKLSENNKTTMIQLFRQMYVLGIKDIDKLSKMLKISPVNIRVTKNRLEAFITNYVKSGEFQKYLKQKTGKHLDFPNNEFKTNKSYLSEGDKIYKL